MFINKVSYFNIYRIHKINMIQRMFDTSHLPKTDDYFRNEIHTLLIFSKIEYLSI